MTDQVSFNDGDPRGDNQCELPTILSLQALDGLSAPESRIQAVPETAESGTPMNRDLRNCCDPYLNHARIRKLGFVQALSCNGLVTSPGRCDRRRRRAKTAKPRTFLNRTPVQ